MLIKIVELIYLRKKQSNLRKCIVLNSNLVYLLSSYINMNVVYFKTIHRNKLMICILTHMKVNNIIKCYFLTQGIGISLLLLYLTV